MCFVLGANLHRHVIEGFARRIWKKLGIDKIGMVRKGVFLVRFKTLEDLQKAYAMSGIMFDKKTLS